MSDKLRIIVAGYIVGYPLGGMTWHHLNYLAGLHALGHEVTFYEDSGQWLQPYNPANNTCSDDPSYGISYLNETLQSIRLPLRWCYRSELLNQYFGMTRDEWLTAVSGADLLLCVSGVTPWRAEFRLAKKTCVIDTDPVFTQLRMRHDEAFLDYYRLFDHVATFGKIIGTPDCPLPTAGFDWIGTNQPIALDHWPAAPGHNGAFSTIGKWEHSADRTFEFAGKSFASSKGVEWMKLLDLPRRTDWRMEMAMASLPDAVQRQFTDNGWGFTDATSASISTDAYRNFIRAHAGEFTVAKQIYAGLPSGWFSDRSACFLASGKPVITQSSGFEKWLPTGDGLFSFSSIDDAALALASITKDYARHSAAARSVAEQYFDARIVLSELIDRMR
ncbi:MAG: hypothetical protein H7144_10470 [Burkholderiales bacterium]|nr:hypothetical protein [Phycisphaerae bacterium]